MNFIQAITSGFTKYAVFSGRASRSEYWYFFAFRMVCYFIAAKIDEKFLLDHMQSISAGPVVFQLGLLVIILRLFFLLPATATGVRRLHDLNKSGWWFLVAITGIGLLPLWGLFFMKGSEGENRFGPVQAISR